MRTIFTLFILTILLINNGVFAQTDFPLCGTEVSPAEIQDFLLVKDQLEAQEQRRTSASSRSLIEVPIQIHAIRPSNGLGGPLFNDVTNAFLSLNEAFDSAGFYFIICGPVNYIDNDEWYDMEKSAASAITAEHYFPDAINIYLTNSITGSTGNGIAGFAPLPYSPRSRPNYIFVTNSSTRGAASTVVHEMGHFYGLYHTHGNTVNCGRTDELVDGSNCSDAGDYICDTPADPGLNCFPETSVTSNCIYTGTAVDTNDMAYEPDVTNFMSYAPRQCREYFSPEQISRMVSVQETYRNNLICEQEQICDNPNGLNIILIRDNSCILIYNTVLGAPDYNIEIREAGGDWKPLPGNPLTVNNITIDSLTACTDYELRLQSNCFAGIFSSYNVITFRTRGCAETCRTPTGLQLKKAYYAAGEFEWDENTDALAFQTRIRSEGSSEWELGEWGTETSAVWELLQPGEQYYVQVRMECNSTISAWSKAVEVTTLKDEEDDYCYTYGLASTNWMAGLDLADLIHTNDREYGYWNYTDFAANVEQGEVFDLILRPATTTTSSQPIYWQIWVDINEDNRFDETELLLQVEGNNQEATVTTVPIPAQYPMGNFRMRVAMSQQADEASCETSAAQRDVKDFTLTVGIGLSATEETSLLSPVKVYPNPASAQLFVDASGLPPADLMLELWNYEGKKLLEYKNSTAGSRSIAIDHLPTGIYAYRISTATITQTGRLIIQR